MNKRVLLCTVAAGALFNAAQAAAQSSSALSNQVQQLQVQIQQLQQQLQSLQTQVNTPPPPPPQAAAPPPGPKLVQSPANRFSIQSADGQYSVGISAQIHFDMGGYAYHPDSAATTPHDLNSGVNARRARIGLVGTFAGDWAYTLVYDFGGSTDSGSSGINAGGIEKAYATYNGFNNKNYVVPLAFDLGYQDLPYTLEEATSSNDIMFLERASSQVVAANIAAGDFRSGAGVRSYTDRYWAGIYATGPNSGANHASTTGGTGGNGEQFGAFGRLTYQVLQDQDYTLHAGVDAEGLLKPGTTSGVRSIVLSDRPELRIDPTTILTTPTAATAGALGTAGNPLQNAAVYSFELAGNYQNFFGQAEGFNYKINRLDLPSNTFWGGYLEGSWTITGEEHKYIPATGAYGPIVPAQPFSLDAMRWGAFELAARYSIIDLNDNTSSAAAVAAVSPLKKVTSNAVAGGRQQIVTLGLNWYLNPNLRFMFDYLHGTIDKHSVSATFSPLFPEAGASFDAIAMRTQIAF